jgi:hypothetical protein
VCWARAAPPSGRARCRPRSRPAPPRPSRSLPWSRPFGRGSVERMRGCCRASCRPPAADAAGRPTPGSTTSTKS